MVSASSASCPSCGSELAATGSADALLALLAEEYTRAVRAGRSPGIDEYERRYPNLAGRIRELFPTLMLLEDLAGAAGPENAVTAAGTTTSASSQSPPMARFITGTIIAQRYRIVGLIGRGGMGEVYRAEDLKLGQQVALKFLPDPLALDGAALARFHHEVSVARRVSHPNVCRVFDIGEVEGHHFLSMEYIDGEDLASLLRRIGRFPADKAVQIAREICAGLAAAHENQVLHRDIKPANIMIDGRGRAHITDFGLAVRTGQGPGEAIRAGTPAYMAPEQLAGKEATVKSDVYALGLVLYEIFTGQRAFKSDSIPDLIRLRERNVLPRPSSLARGIDFAVERIILRCLEKDPEGRPSAFQVAAALPGRDPLAEALAAGETPSPEMVAASPTEKALRPVVALVCLAALVSCLFLMIPASRGMLHRLAPLETSPQSLAFEAARIAKDLGLGDPRDDSAYGLARNDEFLDYVARYDLSPSRWDQLRAGRPTAIYFWYRRSPSPIVAYSLGRISPSDPPLTIPGMANIFLDSRGRLIELQAVPSPVLEVRDPPPVPNWQALFSAAVLDMASFTRAAPSRMPPVMCDSRAAWTGVFPDRPGTPIRVEAAAYQGTPVFFKILGAWTANADATRWAPAEGRVGFQKGARSPSFFTFAFIVFMLSMCAGVPLAHRNLRLGRGDRKGAFRLALYIFITQMLSWALHGSHVAMMEAQFDRFYAAVAWALFYAGQLWIIYIALEPYVRRNWPYRIISWSRVLAGNRLDPLIGRDVLIGALAGTATTLMVTLTYLFARYLGIRPDIPPSVGLESLLGIHGVFGLLLAMQREVIGDSMFIMVVLLLMSSILRKEWLTFGAAWLVFAGGTGMLVGAHYSIDWILVGIGVAAYILVLARFGLLAAIVFQFYNFLLLNFPLPADLSAANTGGTVAVLFLALALAYYGFRTSLAGQRIFRAGLLTGLHL